MAAAEFGAVSPAPAPTTGVPESTDLFEDAPAGLVATSPDGTVVSANVTFLRMIGREGSEVVGAARFQEFLSPAGQLFYETRIAPLIHTHGSVTEVTLELARADESRLPLLVSVAFDTDRALLRFAMIDITGRRNHERGLAVATRRIERLQRITAKFATALDSAAIGEAALDEIVDGIKADHGVVAMVDESSGELRVLSIRTESDACTAAWSEPGVIGTQTIASVVASGRSVFLQETDGVAVGMPPLATSVAVTRVAVVPLGVDDRVFGVMVLGSTSAAQYNAEEQSFLDAFGALCAQALERARLHDLTAAQGRRESFLSQAGRSIDEAVTAVERAQRVVDLLVPEFADFATVELPALGARPLAAQHRDPELLEPLYDLRTSVNIGADKAHSLARARESRAPQILFDIPEAIFEDYDLDAGQIETLRRLSPRSYVGLPLLARNEVVGGLMVVMSESGRRFSPDQVPFFVELAERVAIALENARLYERERDLATRLQLSLLPEAMPADPRFLVAAEYEPSAARMRVGGDWYDTFLLDDDRLAFVVGDVVGHDIDAALVMGQLRTATRAFALDGGGAASTLTRLSDFCSSVPGAMATTVTYAEIDLGRGLLTYASAGHLPPIVITAAGPARALWGGRTTPLGLDAGRPVEEATQQLEAGATVLLITDGVIERRGVPIDESLGQLTEAVSHPEPDRRPADLIAIAFDQLSLAADRFDDRCAVAVQFDPRHIDG